jgi:tRNA pseudouridine13 synthase
VEGPARVRRLTEGLPGVGGRLRERLEDFVVDEVPLYEPLGDGDQVLFGLEKRGTSTFEALLWVSKSAKVSEHVIGYAGLKDARAVTRQVMSVPRVPPERLLAIRHPKVRVLWAARHPTRVRIGHLRGNRFAIRVRGARADRADAAREALDVLARRGVPNAYGTQRFGLRQDGHLLGRAVVRGDLEGFVGRLLGRPDLREGDLRVRAAREAFDRGDVARAFSLFPSKHRVAKKALSAILRGGDAAAAFDALGRRPRRIYVSAYQSWLFNRCLDARMAEGTHDRLLGGDLAWQHATGALYAVCDPAAEAGRALALEASPTGPLPGYDLRRPAGAPRRLEDAALAPEGLTDEAFRQPRVRVRGARRPFRVPLTDASIEVEDRSTLLVRFTLPPGAFATVVLDELMKVDAPPGVEDPAEPVDDGVADDDEASEVEEDGAGADVPTGP